MSPIYKPNVKRPKAVSLDPLHPEDCEHHGADMFGLPGAGELLWCTQCGSIKVVSDGHEHAWELPYRKRKPRGRDKRRTVKRSQKV